MMLSHKIKKILDEATGLKFSPVIGMSESYPIASYSLSDYSDESIKQSQLEVRVISEDFDELEVLREKIKDKLHSKTEEAGIKVDEYFIRAKISGGTILPHGDNLFESTQFFIINWRKY
ncbi:hypothetical protein [uncultured Parvimonas sp.]|uniref:hypothetical protein n=1 Tax=uncultured Parvimonas sp. TaxID=747372 RepID=UPI002592916C|nr:hypothetical protein [uncultured Parvimonas sp.]